MPRCTICTHPERASIDAAIVTDQASIRDIAGQFSVSRSAIGRHAQQHIGAPLKTLQDAKDELQIIDVFQQLRDINTATLAILKDAQDAKQHLIALQAIDRIQRQIELQAKLLGELSDAPQITVSLPASWEEIELAIRQALSAYPEARVAVATALTRLEHARLN